MEEFNNWFQDESNLRVQDLPHLGALIELWELVTVIYDTNSIKSVLELIKSGEESPTPWSNFVVKYDLDWEVYTLDEGKVVSIVKN